MANGEPYARMLKVMERQGTNMNGQDMTIAKIVSIDPLQIAVNGIVTTPEISNNLVCNKLLTSDKDEELDEILENEKYISSGLKQFLKDVYKELRTQPGDMVLVQRVNNSFYICGKVGSNEQ